MAIASPRPHLTISDRADLISRHFPALKPFQGRDGAIYCPSTTKREVYYRLKFRANPDGEIAVGCPCEARGHCIHLQQWERDQDRFERSRIPVEESRESFDARWSGILVPELAPRYERTTDVLPWEESA